MDFVNQELAKEFRLKADHDIKAFVNNIVATLIEECKLFDLDYTDKIVQSGIKSFIDSKVDLDLPASVSLLLYRSGMVFPPDREGVYPCIRYYDNDSSNDFTVADAMRQSRGSLVGGIKDSQIHT